MTTALLQERYRSEHHLARNNKNTTKHKHHKKKKKIGQSYVCSVTSNFPMVVTDPGSWVWAGAACARASRCPGW